MEYYLKKTITALAIAFSIILFCTSCFKKSKEAIEEEIKKSIQNTLQTAQNYIDAGKTSEAIKTLETIQQKHPANIKILESLSFAYLEAKEPALAAFYFEEIFRIEPELFEYLIFAAQAYESLQEWQQAAKNYQCYLEAFPEDLSVLSSLAHTYEQNKQLDKAIQAYLKLHNLSPTPPQTDVLFNIARLYEKNDQPTEATHWYYKVLQQDTNHKNALLALLKLELELKNLPLAEKILKTLESMNLSNVDKHFVGAQKENFYHLNEASKTTPLQPSSLFAEKSEPLPLNLEAPLALTKNTGLTKDRLYALFDSLTDASLNNEEPTTQLDLKQPARSEEIFKKALQNAQNGNYDKAAHLCWKAIKINPAPAEYWLELSKNLSIKKRWEHAIVASKQAMNRKPLEVTYWLNFIEILEAHPQTSPEKLGKELFKAKKQFENNPEITLKLANYYHDVLKNKKIAKLLYEEFLQQASNHPKKQEISERLAFLH